MSDKQILDIYSDYLWTSFSYTTATGLALFISYDQVTRFPSSKMKTSKELWLLVKSLQWRIESPAGVLIRDDSIEEKPCTNENGIVCRYYEQAPQRNVKGINFVSCLYQRKAVSCDENRSLPRRQNRTGKTPLSGLEKLIGTLVLTNIVFFQKNLHYLLDLGVESVS